AAEIPPAREFRQREETDASGSQHETRLRACLCSTRHSGRGQRRCRLAAGLGTKVATRICPAVWLVGGQQRTAHDGDDLWDESDQRDALERAGLETSRLRDDQKTSPSPSWHGFPTRASQR